MRISAPRPAAVALLSVTLSVVWAAGAHLHLCSDGLEPAVTVHTLADGADHHDHRGAEGEHLDSDVELDVTRTRVSKAGGDSPAVSLHAEHVSAGMRSTLHRPVSAPASVRSATRFLRPPLRAPPA